MKSERQEAKLAWLRLYLCLPNNGVLKAFSTEAVCRSRFAEIRWPNGITCPACGGGVWQLKSRPIYECSSCGRQPSITAGTALAGTRIALRTWFRAAELVVESHAVRHREPYVAGLQRSLQSEDIPLSRKAVGRMLKILHVDLAPHATGLLKSSLSVVPEPSIPHLEPDQQLYWLMDVAHQRWRNLS